MTSTPSVLLVAGAYYPEISAAGLQCQAVAAALKGRARMSVLVTAVDASLPAGETIDGVSVHRLTIDVRRGAFQPYSPRYRHLSGTRAQSVDFGQGRFKSGLAQPWSACSY